ncbi:MAG: PIN domain-containing protein, partial [Candidatus Eremiobacteraeota bacterium]|nr:PIN domain-containing protein [Candidatus Eremiobacteraeota bacterium]
ARTAAEAESIVSSWLSRQNVFLLEPGPSHWKFFFGALAASRSSGPRVTDAHLAALAIEHGATLYTNDADFRRFPGLEVRFPLTE